jgi:glycosyltransferase involved in cell wall biosynthesis
LPDCVIANSAATLSTLSPQQLEHSAAIHSGVDFGSRVSVVHDGTFERHNRKPTEHSGAPLIGLVGRISPWKGQHIFLRAAAQVLKSFPEAKFQIIGAALFNEADYEKFIREMVQTLGIASSVEFLGFRNDVPDLIADLEVLVHASVVGEPFGQVVIEGMAAAKPVVATNGGGVPEIVLDGQTGILVPMGDSTSMANAIVHLLKSPELRQTMGQAARERVREHFTIQSTARKVERLYDEILRRRNGS